MAGQAADPIDDPAPEAPADAAARLAASLPPPSAETARSISETLRRERLRKAGS